MDLLTSKTISERLGITEQTATRLMRLGRIASESIGGQWIASEAAFNAFLRDPKSSYNPKDRKRSEKKIPKHIALSFFSGAMGLDIGLELAGIKTILSCEMEPSARRTILMNRPDIALIGDLLNYSSKDILQFAGIPSGKDVDLIVGGPPCQAFSTAGKRAAFNDKRGNVFLRFVEIILEIKPKFAVIENVRGLLSACLEHVPHEERLKSFGLRKNEKPGSALLKVIELLEKGGYGVSFNLYNSANFGTPQSRERVVILCARDGQCLPFLTPTHHESGKYGLQIWRTFEDAVKGLKKSKNYIPFPEKRLKYYKHLKAGQYWKDLPPEMQKEAMGNSFFSGGGKTGFLRRLAWDKPSPTLVTHPAMPATDLAHPIENRPLSIEEYMRIQEFPDDYVICGSITEQYKQIGNAVPVGLGRAIGHAIISHLNKRKIKQIEGFEFSRYKNTDRESWLKQMGFSQLNLDI
jgi:DNA (cytosine-5)-methyltransferase 1